MIWIVSYFVVAVLAFFVFAALNTDGQGTLVGAILWPIPLLWLLLVCALLIVESWRYK